jgi:vancomycin permeability regulator SanA
MTPIKSPVRRRAGRAAAAVPARSVIRRSTTRRLLALGVLAALGVAQALTPPAVWTAYGSRGHLFDVASAPTAPVVIVFGAELESGGKRPKPFLAGRLATTADLVRAGRATAVLVSGDGHGSSGDEVSVMADSLVARGVPARRIVVDADGLDTYDTCRRARDVYGVRRALLVSQALHLPRAVTLCRTLGIDADGVAASCDGCQFVTRVYNRTRELAANWKAVFDAGTDRPPAVTSPPDPALTRALAG